MTSPIHGQSNLCNIHLKRKNSNLAIFTSTLIESKLASNAKSETSLRPKRIPFRAPEFKRISPPLKKISSYLINSSSSLDLTSSLVPRFSSSTHFHLEWSKFHASAFWLQKKLSLMSLKTYKGDQRLKEKSPVFQERIRSKES